MISRKPNQENKAEGEFNPELEKGRESVDFAGENPSMARLRFLTGKLLQGSISKGPPTTRTVSVLRPIAVARAKGGGTPAENGLCDSSTQSRVSTPQNEKSNSPGWRHEGLTTISRAGNLKKNRKKVDEWNELKLEAMIPSTLQTVRTETCPTARKRKEIIWRDHSISWWVSYSNAIQDKVQGNALANFQKNQRLAYHGENHILTRYPRMRNRTRGELIMRRGQRVPRTSSSGFEQSHWTEEVIDPYSTPPDSAFFRVAAPLRRHPELFETLTPRQMGYGTVLERVARPLIPGEGVPPAPPGNPVCPAPPTADDPTQPLNTMSVIGRNYTAMQRYIAECNKLQVNPNPGTNRKKGNVEVEGNSNQADNKSAKKFRFGHARRSEAPVRADSFVCLEFGDYELIHSNNSDKSAVYVVEAGSTAALGQCSVSFISMRNKGTTVIRYAWSKTKRSDPLGVNSTIFDRFVFDSWGGCVLPGERYRAPVVYKATSAGYFSEDWQLVTQPVLENGAKIILRIWGITAKVDAHVDEKEKVEEELRRRMSRNIAETRVDKIMDYLPLPESETGRDIKFVTLMQGPVLFEFNNPGFFYKTSAVYRLDKLSELMNQRKVQQGRKDEDLHQHNADVFITEDDEESDDLVYAEDSEEDEDVSVVTSGRGLPAVPPRVSAKGQAEVEDGDDEDYGAKGDENNVEDLEADLQRQSYFAEDSFSEFNKMLDSFIDIDKANLEAQERKNQLTTSMSDLAESRPDDNKMSQTHSTEAPPGHVGHGGPPSLPAQAGAQVHDGTAAVGGSVAEPEPEHQEDQVGYDRLVLGGVVVDDLRRLILTDKGEPSHVHAVYNVFTKETDGLKLRPFLAAGNWRYTICLGGLGQVINRFEEFAGNLEKFYLESYIDQNDDSMTDLEGLDEYEAKSVEKTDVSQKGGLLTEDYNEVSPKSRISPSLQKQKQEAEKQESEKSNKGIEKKLSLNDETETNRPRAKSIIPKNTEKLPSEDEEVDIVPLGLEGLAEQIVEVAKPATTVRQRQLSRRLYCELYLLLEELVTSLDGLFHHQAAHDIAALTKAQPIPKPPRARLTDFSTERRKFEQENARPPAWMSIYHKMATAHHEEKRKRDRKCVPNNPSQGALGVDGNKWHSMKETHSPRL